MAKKKDSTENNQGQQKIDGGEDGNYQEPPKPLTKLVNYREDMDVVNEVENRIKAGEYNNMSEFLRLAVSSQLRDGVFIELTTAEKEFVSKEGNGVKYLNPEDAIRQYIIREMQRQEEGINEGNSYDISIKISRKEEEFYKDLVERGFYKSMKDAICSALREFRIMKEP